MANRIGQARARLAAISSHLTATSFSGDDAPIVELSPVSAEDGALANLAGSLTVIDWRTGKRSEIKVSEEGTVKATDFKKMTTRKNDKGIKLYDPGYLNTAPVRSSISYIDGDLGILWYRGHPIEELAENSTFMEVAYLLMVDWAKSKQEPHADLNAWPNIIRIEELGHAVVYVGAKFRAPVQPYDV